MYLVLLIYLTPRSSLIIKNEKVNFMYILMICDMERNEKYERLFSKHLVATGNSRVILRSTILYTCGPQTHREIRRDFI